MTGIFGENRNGVLVIINKEKRLVYDSLSELEKEQSYRPKSIAQTTGIDFI
jgi:hypothetical protein